MTLIEQIEKMNENEVLHFTIKDNPYDHFYVRKFGKDFRFINPYFDQKYIRVSADEFPQFVEDNTADGVGTIEFVTETVEGLDWNNETELN